MYQIQGRWAKQRPMGGSDMLASMPLVMNMTRTHRMTLPTKVRLSRRGEVCLSTSRFANGSGGRKLRGAFCMAGSILLGQFLLFAAFRQGDFISSSFGGVCFDQMDMPPSLGTIWFTGESIGGTLRAFERLQESQLYANGNSDLRYHLAASRIGSKAVLNDRRNLSNCCFTVPALRLRLCTSNRPREAR
jgi:hypothetical protein